MQVQNAAQIGAQSAWKACDPNKELPATTKCPGLKTAVAAAIKSTTLGDKVTLASAPAEAIIASIAANALIPDGGIALGSKPANCNAVTGHRRDSREITSRLVSPTVPALCFSTSP